MVRKNTNGVPVGGKPFAPMFQQQSTYLSNSSVTYVPTKMKMSITCYPVVVAIKLVISLVLETMPPVT